MGGMRPLLRLAVRDARRHWVRTGLMLATIALPILAVLVLLSSLTPQVTPRQEALDALPDAARADVTASTVGGPVQQLPEQLPPVPRDPSARPSTPEELTRTLPSGITLHEWWVSPELIATTALDLPAGETRPAEAAQVVGSLEARQLTTVTLREADAQTLELLIGTAPTGADGIVLTQAAAEATGVGEGEVLQLIAPPDTGWMSTDGRLPGAVENSQRGYRVDQVIPGDQAQAWALPEWIAPMIAADQKGVDRHFLVTGEQPITWSQTKTLNRDGVFVISRDVLENYPPRAELYPVPVDLERLAIMAVLLGTTAVGITALLAVLVTPAFVVGATRMRRELGVMVTSGARPRRAGAVFMLQAVVMGAAGGLLGVGGAAVVAAILARPFPLLAAAAALLLAVLVALLCALPAARAVARQDPVDALADRRRLSRRPRTRREDTMLGRLPLPTMLRLAARDAGRHRARTVPAVAAVLACTAALTALSIMVGSAQSNADDQATAMVAPGRAGMGIETPISDEVDQAVIHAVLAEMPVAAHGELWSISKDGPLLEAAPRQQCGPEEGVSVRSALDPSAPIECVRWDRAWSPGLGFPTWVGNEVTIMEPETMRLTGLPGAEEAADALAAGAVVINDATRLHSDGTVELRASADDASGFTPLATVPGHFLRGAEPSITMTPQMAQELELPSRYVGEIVVPEQELDLAAAQAWGDQAREVTTLAWPLVEPTPDALGFAAWGLGPSPARPLLWGLTCLAVLATLLALALGRKDAETDLGTMQAIGARPGQVRRYGLAQAGIVLLVGVPTGLVLGAAVSVGLLAALRASQEFGPFLHPTLLPVALAVGLTVMIGGSLLGALVIAPRRGVLTRQG